MDSVKWCKAGAEKKLRILVIAPLGCRLKKGGKLLHRHPHACSARTPMLPLAEALQYHLWRWGIEVDFREEKSLIGTGDAQVRGEAASEHEPAMTVAAYSHLWVAALEALGANGGIQTLRPPKWRAPKAPPTVPTTGELLRLPFGPFGPFGFAQGTRGLRPSAGACRNGCAANTGQACCVSGITTPSRPGRHRTRARRKANPASPPGSSPQRELLKR